MVQMRPDYATELTSFFMRGDSRREGGKDDAFDSLTRCETIRQQSETIMILVIWLTLA